MDYLPSLRKLSQETIATLVAVILTAVIISQFPAIKKLVNDNR